MPRSLASASLLSLLLAACGDVPDPGASDGDTADSSGSTTDTGGSDGTSTGGSTTDAPGSSTSSSGTGSDPDPTTGDVTTAVDPTAGSTTGGPGTTGDNTTGDVDPGAPDIPAPTAACPDIEDGTISFHPAGLDAPRDVRVWVDLETAARLDGPVVFYWYGTGGNPDQTYQGVGDDGIQEILDMGGIVVAPTHDPLAGVFPWWLVLSETTDDLVLADEILACASEQIGVDARRIYSLGFSAGALHTSQMSIRRSSYIASVVPYSGGLVFGSMPAFEDPDNKFAAMIFHGGPGDMVVVGFQQTSEDYAAYLDGNDNFNFICNHGGGHSVPNVQDNVMQFLLDHPWGVGASPYAQALPGDFPPYCAL